MQWVTAQWKHLDLMAVIMSQKERCGSAHNPKMVEPKENTTPKVITGQQFSAEDRTLVSGHGR